MTMRTATIIIKDEVNIKIEGLELDVRKKLVNTFKYEMPGARYQPAVRLCLLYTSPSPRDGLLSRMPSSA